MFLVSISGGVFVGWVFHSFVAVALWILAIVLAVGLCGLVGDREECRWPRRKDELRSVGNAGGVGEEAPASGLLQDRE